MALSDDLWEALGEVGEDDLPHMVSTLFVFYEKLQRENPDSEEARLFFKNLGTAIDQVKMCNLNRR